MFEHYAAAIKKYKEEFTRFGHTHLADSLRELQLMNSAREKPTTNEMEVIACGGSSSHVAEQSQAGPSQAQVVADSWMTEASAQNKTSATGSSKSAG